MKTAIPTILALAALAMVLYKAEFSPVTRQATGAPPAAAAGAETATGEVYLWARADGKDGTGTQADPLNASTQEKFDALFKSFGPNTAIHLGPGTYHTKGVASFSVKPYWKIHGAGYEVTKIIQDNTKQIHCCVFGGRGDGVEIEDLSIDCGFQNQQVVNGAIKANASAIGLGGSHMAVRRCWFKNYGSPYDADTGENFAVFLGSADPDNGENLVVEDCIFAGMTPLLHGGQSVLTVAGGPSKNDLNVGNWARGCIARRNHFTGYHFGCHGITVSGTQGTMVVDNVFEHFMGACVYQDTWPMRDIIIANNIMSDVDEGIRLCGDNLPMDNFQIRNNVMLMHDGFDIVSVKDGLVTTAINHSYAVGNKIKFHKVQVTAGAGLKGEAYVTSVPSPTTFTYSLTARGPTQTADAGTGGFIQALDYQCMAPAPEGIVVFTGGGEKLFPPTNFIIDHNIIKPYSSDDTSRVPSVGIATTGLKNSQITNNVVFDSGERQFGSEGIDEIVLKKVAPAPGQHADLLVCPAGGVSPTVVCRNNYHPDGTPLLPRDNQFKLIPGGLPDAAPDVAGLRLSNAVDAAGPAGDAHSAGKPGDYAVQADYLYLYIGDGKTHQWKRIKLADY